LAGLGSRRSSWILALSARGLLAERAEAREAVFVALNLPETVRTSLAACVRPVQSMGFALRWMTPAQVHLTLKFLGTWKPEREGEFGRALGRACTGARPVTTVTRGVRRVPHYDRPRVVWLGVAAEPALELLQHRMEQELRRCFPMEARAFRRISRWGGAGTAASPRRFDQLEAAWPICASTPRRNHDRST